ncbi:hypothetical protein Y032_0026g1365 [Ancylostoma ceylanicum]|nr:hypothetical protein Y032_0026g1365 [Ancylostoma ceylanicum]
MICITSSTTPPSICFSITFEAPNAEITVLETSSKLIPPSANTPAEKTQTKRCYHVYVCGLGFTIFKFNIVARQDGESAKTQNNGGFHLGALRWCLIKRSRPTVVVFSSAPVRYCFDVR